MSIVRTHNVRFVWRGSSCRQVEEDLTEQPQLDETDNSASSAKLYLNRK